MSIRIAFIIERADVALGGAERSVFETAEAVLSLGYDVNILAAKGQSENANLKILCKGQHGKRTDFCTFERILKNYLAQNHYDVIHSVLPFDFADIYQPRGGSYPEATIRNSASYQNAFVEWWKNTTSFMNARRAKLALAEKRLCEKTDGPIVAALSNYVAEQFKLHYNLINERLVIIPNGVKIKTQIPENESAKLRNLLEMKSKNVAKMFFLFAANNFRLKGLKPLLEAIRVAKKDNFILIVAGNGEIKKYSNLAKKYGITDKVVFTGSLGHIQSVLSICDAAVLPTFYDPASRFILEALVAGKPVITTKYNGASDLFTPDKHGKIIDSPGNISALAQTLSYFADINNIRKASQAIVEDNLRQNISIERAAKQLDSVYKIIFERKK